MGDGSGVELPLREASSSIGGPVLNGALHSSHHREDSTYTTTASASTSTSATQRTELASPRLPNGTNGLGIRSLGNSASRSTSPIAVAPSGRHHGALGQSNTQRLSNASTAQVPVSTFGTPGMQLPLSHPPSGIQGIAISTHGIPSSRKVSPIATTTQGSRKGIATSAAQASTPIADPQKSTSFGTNPTMVSSGIQLKANDISSSHSARTLPTIANPVGTAAQVSTPSTISSQRPQMSTPYLAHDSNSVGCSTFGNLSSRNVSPIATTTRVSCGGIAVTPSQTSASIVQAQRTMSASPYSPMVSSGIQLDSNGISSPPGVSPIAITSHTFSPVLSTSSTPTTSGLSVMGNRTPSQNGLELTQEFSALAGAVVPTPEQTENNMRRRSSGASFSALAGAVVPTPEQTQNNLRRRSSGAKSRPSSATSYASRGSDVVAETNPALQPVATPIFGSRTPSLQLQPDIVTAGSGIHAAGYRVSSISPHLTSPASFASPSPPVGTGLSPTLSTSGRFSSPLVSATSPLSWREQATALTSYSATYATYDTNPVNPSSAPARQRSSIQGVLNTSARTSLSASRPPSNSHIIGAGNGSVRKIDVGSNGVVAERTATNPSHPSRTGVIESMAQSVQVPPQDLLATSAAASLALLQQAQISSLKAMSAIQGGAAVPSLIAPPHFDRMHMDDQASRSSIRRESVVSTNPPVAIAHGAPPLVHSNTRTFKTPPAATCLLASESTTVPSRTAPQPITVIDTATRDPHPSKAVSVHEKELGLMIAKKAHDDDRTKPSSEQPPQLSAVASPAAESVHTPSAKADTVMEFLAFEFKPPANPIPSLPDWLSGADKGEKSAKRRPSLPDWASGRLEEAGFAIVPSVNGNKRRRTKSPDQLWIEGGVGSADLPIDVDDAASDIHVSPSSPDVRDRIAQRTEQTLDMHVDDAEPVVLAREEAVAEVLEGSAKPFTHANTAQGEQTSKASVDVDSVGPVPLALGPIRRTDLQSEKHLVREDGRASVGRAPASSVETTSSGSPAAMPDQDVGMLDASRVEIGLDSAPMSSPSANRNPDILQFSKLPCPERLSSHGTASLVIGSPTQDGEASDWQPPAHPGIGNAAANASSPSGTPIADLEGPRKSKQEETPRPADPIVHHISSDITSEDIVRWQRKVWRACFCEWVGCGAVLNSWNSLEKVRTQSDFVCPAC